jgi:hypothetical protein
MPALQTFLQRLARREFYRRGRGNLDFFAGPRITAFAGRALQRLEAAETGNGNGIAILQRAGNDGEQFFVSGFSLARVASPVSSFRFLTSSAFVMGTILDGF